MNRLMVQVCFESKRFNWLNGLKLIINVSFNVICGLLVAAAISAHAQIPLVGATKVALGDSFSCAITAESKVKCWGRNVIGQLGDGTTTDRLTAVDTIGLTDVTSISLGTYHACALTVNGAVKCWGYNEFGQLGDGTNTHRMTAVNVSGLSSGVVAIAAGAYHTCALTDQGRVKCWGQNDVGQLGDSTGTNRSIPADVVGLTGVTSVSAGEGHSCALLANSNVKCWGYTWQTPGNDGNLPYSRTPFSVTAATGVIAIDSGGFFTCALTNTGSVKCWGYNERGQLGNGSTSNIPRPWAVDVNDLQSNVIAFTSGKWSSCALINDGSVKCWGEWSSNPSVMSGLTGVTALDYGLRHACALVANGLLQCWGQQFFGELGNNSLQYSMTVPVTALQAFSPIIGLATAGNTQATVRFTPPSYDSGSPITGYTVTSNPAGGIDAYAGTTDSYTGPSELSHLITGLVNGTSYTFTVTATNALGTGLPSVASNSVIPSLPANSSSVASSNSSSVLSSSSVNSSNSSSSLVSSAVASLSSVSSSSAISFSSISSNISQSSSALSSSFVSSSTSFSSINSFISSSSLSSASSSISSAVNSCSVVVPTTFGTTYSGTLTASDCTSGSRATNYYTDKYSFTVTAGQQVSILLTSSAFDAYVYLKNSSGTVISSDDDGGGSRNSRIPATSGYYTLSVAGTYTVEVTSYSTFATGAYSLLVSVNNSVASSSSSSTSSSSSSSANTCVSVVAVSGVTNNGALASTDCTNGASGTSKYTDRYTFNAAPGQQISILLTSTAFDTYVYLKNPSGVVITSNDDGGGGQNSRIPATSGVYTIPAGTAGTYVIEVSSYSTFATGTYSLLYTIQ